MPGLSVLFAVLGSLALIEWGRMFELPLHHRVAVVIANVVIIGSIAVAGVAAADWLVGALVLVGVAWPVVRADTGRAIRDLGMAAVGVILVSVLLAHGVALGVEHGEAGLALVVALAVACAFSDVGAFVVGRRFGRTPLAPRLSPAKTREGVIGNLLGAGLGILAMAPAIVPTFGVPFAIVLVPRGRRRLAVGRPARERGEAGGRDQGRGRLAARVRRDPRPDRLAPADARPRVLDRAPVGAGMTGETPAPDSRSSTGASRRLAAGSSRPRPWSPARSRRACSGRSSAGSSSGPRVVGREHLAELEGPSLITPTHASHFDFSAIRLALGPKHRRRISAAAAADYFATKRSRWFVAAWMGAFAFNRTGRGADSIAAAEGLLAAGWHVVLFPEGTRTTTGDINAFQPGIGLLARHTGRQVLPVRIVGIRRVLPKGAARPHRYPVEVRIGAPIRALPGEDARAFTARLEERVRSL